MPPKQPLGGAFDPQGALDAVDSSGRNAPVSGPPAINAGLL